MKFTIAPESLLEGLTLASSTAATRTPKPALQGVLIQALEDMVLLMATDLELGIRYRLTQVAVDHQGEALLPAAKLAQIIRESAEETVLLELEENNLHIRGSDCHFRILSGDAREFPPVPDLQGEADFELTGLQLRRLIDRTLFAAAKESSRYAIDGLLWDRQGEYLRVVATDGRRLALSRCQVAKPGGSENHAIVPAKVLALLGRVIGDPEEPFEIRFLSNQVLFSSPRVTISSVLVEGHFPKYEDVIPQDFTHTVRVQVPAMLSAVRRSALLTSEESKSIRLRFGDGKVVLTGRAPEQGEASVEVAVPYDEEPLEIGFNPGFLVDVLKIIDEDELDLLLKDASRPGMFRQGEDYLYVVMPVNLS